MVTPYLLGEAGAAESFLAAALIPSRSAPRSPLALMAIDSGARSS
jgi:hypothetical protein